MNKTNAHAIEKEKKLKPIKQKDIKKVLKHKAVKEDGVWVIRFGGREFRNKKKKEVIRDLATINGYKVI